jgi:hypothetical protein
MTAITPTAVLSAARPTPVYVPPTGGTLNFVTGAALEVFKAIVKGALIALPVVLPAIPWMLTFIPVGDQSFTPFFVGLQDPLADEPMRYMRYAFLVSTAAACYFLYISSIPGTVISELSALRLPYTYSLLMGLKAFTNNPAQAGQFYDKAILNLCYSAIMVKGIQICTNAGIKILTPLAVLSLLPLITDIWHRLSPTGENLNSTLKESCLNTALPLALGMASGSLAHLTLAVAYVYIKTSLPLNLNVPQQENA